jgi:NADPH-dependent ferric siderophore reductase
MRTYTVRNHRAAACEVDLDFALHGDLAGMGPASRWAMQARPGDRATLFGPAASYCPPPDARWLLIAGDECALPAIGGIVASLPPGVPSRVLVEIPDEGERQDIAAPPGSTLAELAWLSRRGGPARHSTLLIDAIRRRPIPDGPGYVWLAGESSVVRGLRRHLVWDRGLDRGRITFSGYWRAGHAESDN